MVEVVGEVYILEVIEEIGDGFSFAVGKDIVVVDFRAAWKRRREGQ